jgi:putative PIN family toxin of toxin-antitoxin system
MTVKVVLDTNDLISGIFFSGPPFAILKAWRKELVPFILSTDIINEYNRVAKILGNEYPDIDVNSILTLIITHSEIIEAPPLTVQVCEDSDDDKFFACALVCECKTIISGDKHLLKLSGYNGISVFTPRAFVDRCLKKQQ